MRFLMMIVTVKLPMCIVIRMVSPPFGKCGQPPAVVVQRLAADGGVISIAYFDTLRKVTDTLRGVFLCSIKQPLQPLIPLVIII